MDAYRRSPEVRFAIRTVVVAVLTYLTAALAQGGEFLDWGTVAYGMLGAALKTAIGLLTPEEPFVGIKASHVEVPVPPAEPER